MNHFWLAADQQAIMDTATSTAKDYSHIAVLKLGRSWKKELKGQTGHTVAESAYLRTFNVTREYNLRHDSLVRLTRAQAMTMKLRYAGGNDGHVSPDPTGEFWGNMLVAQHDQMTGNYSTGFRYSAELPYARFINGDGFGPTISTVADHCSGLPLSWGTHLVWMRAADWHAAKNIIPQPQVDDAEQSTFAEVFQLPPQTMGKLWARSVWETFQVAHRRRSYGVCDVANEPVL